MKICKKTLSLILAAAILLSVAVAVAVGTVADDIPALDESKPNIIVEADKDTAKAGETVELTFSINNNPGIWAINFTCKIDDGLTLVTDGTDSDGFTKVKYEVGENFKKYVSMSPAENKELTYLYSYSKMGFNNTNSGKLFSVWVNAKEETSIDENSIKFIDYSIIDNNKKDIEFTFGTKKNPEDGAVTTNPTETTVITNTTAEKTTTVKPTTAKPVAPTTIAPTTAKPVASAVATMNLKTKAKINITALKKAVKVKISKAVKNADGYQIKIAKNKSFKKATTKVTTKKTLKIGKLKAKTKYFVKVRAYETVNGKKVYGAWSKVYSKKTK